MQFKFIFVLSTSRQLFNRCKPTESKIKREISQIVDRFFSCRLTIFFFVLCIFFCLFVFCHAQRFHSEITFVLTDFFFLRFLLFVNPFADTSSSSPSPPMKEPTVQIQCLSGSMLITIKDAPSSPDSGLFNGMVYPKGLSKNSTCLKEYR